jgi:hypothetical protein
VTIVVVILTLVLLAAVVAVISGPLRHSRAPRSSRIPASGQRSALEAAREAKYREIKDAELDFETGKLSREDYEELRGSLRAEAVEILDRLAALERESHE